MSLRLTPGEQLSKDQLMEIGRECAKEFGVADNQYICVLHKDTKEQHIHNYNSQTYKYLKYILT
jgi:hypothetical protein